MNNISPATSPFPALRGFQAIARWVTAAISQVARTAGLGDGVDNPSARHGVYKGRLPASCTKTTVQITQGNESKLKEHHCNIERKRHVLEQSVQSLLGIIGLQVPSAVSKKICLLVLGCGTVYSRWSLYEYKRFKSTLISIRVISKNKTSLQIFMLTTICMTTQTEISCETFHIQCIFEAWW